MKPVSVCSSTEGTGPAAKLFMHALLWIGPLQLRQVLVGGAFCSTPGAFCLLGASDLADSCFSQQVEDSSAVAPDYDTA
jgi:hypothetical protein